MSFLSREKLPWSFYLVAGLMVVLGLLVILDGFNVVNLHGVGTPMIAALGIVSILLQRNRRKKEEIVGHD